MAAACAAVAMFGRATPVLAAEEDRGVPAERLERLEQRVNEMAQRQEQLLQRLGTQQERQASTAAVGAEDMRRRMALRERAGLGQVMPPSRAASLAPASTPAGPPEHDVNLRKKIADMLGLCFLIGVIFNILVAIWIFTDIRKRGEGPGIFVALALLAGIPTAIIYALLRIGDKKA